MFKLAKICNAMKMNYLDTTQKGIKMKAKNVLLYHWMEIVDKNRSKHVHGN